MLLSSETSQGAHVKKGLHIIRVAYVPALERAMSLNCRLQASLQIKAQSSKAFT